jgi:nitronate monooxygenase
VTLLDTLGIDLPIIQAPMAGVSSPAMAAAVSNAGALGGQGAPLARELPAAELVAALAEELRQS